MAPADHRLAPTDKIDPALQPKLTANADNEGNAMRLIVLGLLILLAGCQGAGDTTAAAPSDKLTVPPPGGQQGAAARDCFWSVTIDDAAVNTLYPDIYAKYWVAAIPVIEGLSVTLDGEFPHARYMSFNLYDPLFRPIDAISDRDIEPAADSSNPFVAGAGRDDPARDYVLRIVAATPPAERAPNTLYAHLPAGGAGAQAVPYAIAIYRIYVPDTETDRAGDKPLPRVSFHAPDGSSHRGPEACAALEPFLPSDINERITNAALSLPVPTGFGSFAELNWLKFFGLQSSTENRTNATPLREPVHAVVPNPSGSSGGFASNVDNNYIYAPLNQDHGPLAVFEARMPRAPRTVAGDAVMGSGDMRYWSVCSYEIASQRYYDCLYDENSVLDAKNRGIFLVGREGDRPANATPECGVNWLPWGPLKNALAIIRHMLPEADFGHAIQDVPAPPGACEAPVMGEYFPYGQHMSTADFEALGCPVNPDAIADRANQFEPTEDCPQTPTGEVHSLGPA